MLGSHYAAPLINTEELEPCSPCYAPLRLMLPLCSSVLFRCSLLLPLALLMLLLCSFCSSLCYVLIILDKSDRYNNSNDDSDTNENGTGPGENSEQLRALGNKFCDFAVSVIETQGQRYGYYRKRETECYDC